ncbi:hypothetical protein MKX03_030303, partial [Papaver bracteatum]
YHWATAIQDEKARNRRGANLFVVTTPSSIPVDLKQLLHTPKSIRKRGKNRFICFYFRLLLE